MLRDRMARDASHDAQEDEESAVLLTARLEHP
jgi:hypothetical protein